MPAEHKPALKAIASGWTNNIVKQHIKINV